MNWNETPPVDGWGLSRYITEIIEKYESEGLTKDTILGCVESAIEEAVERRYKYGVCFVVWDGMKPVIYLFKENSVSRVNIDNRSFYNFILNNLYRNLRAMKILSVYSQYRRQIGNVTAGVIEEIHQDHVRVKMDGYPDVNFISSIMRKRDTPVKERDKYFIGYKMLFYIKNILVNEEDKTLTVLLNRTSRKMVTIILRSFVADQFEDYHKYHRRYPVLACVKRVAGVYSDVISDIFIPADVIKIVSLSLGGERIRLKQARKIPSGIKRG